MKDIPLEKRIIFALDVPSFEEAKRWVERLSPYIKFYKVGLELFLACGFPVVEWIRERGCEVMLDLKLFDIPATVKRAIYQIKDRGVTYTTVHGNDGILRAAVEAKGDLKVLAVTVLTSLDESDIKDLGFQCSIEDLVLSRAKRAFELGCDGVVASGRELKAIRHKIGEGLIVVVPGIRPVENRDIDDQKRTITLREAFMWGADHVVVGRPLRNSPEPEKTAQRMLEEVKEVLGI